MVLIACIHQHLYTAKHMLYMYVSWLCSLHSFIGVQHINCKRWGWVDSPDLLTYIRQGCFTDTGAIVVPRISKFVLQTLEKWQMRLSKLSNWIPDMWKHVENKCVISSILTGKHTRMLSSMKFLLDRQWYKANTLGSILIRHGSDAKVSIDVWSVSIRSSLLSGK